MATMTFLTARKEVAAQLGLDYTQSDTDTLLKRWLNLSYQDIVSWKNWSWLQSRDVVTMNPDDTETTLSVTASVSAAGTTVTFSGVIAESQTGRYIQFATADDWYEITAHTAGTNTATIDPAYAQSTAISAGNFTIRTFFYSLASTTKKVYNCRRSESGSRYLTILSADRADRVDAFPEDTGDPETIYMWGQDSSGNWTFTPNPWPDSPLLLEFRVYKKATDLSGDSDQTIFPDEFTSVWLDGAKAYGFESESDDRTGRAFVRFERMLDRLMSRDKTAVLERSTIEPIDFSGGTKRGVRFPDQYGR